MIRNSLFGLLGKVISMLVTFASRTIFIYVLGQYYLGVNGLYGDILMLLSFTELGFGSAMTFALYKPVAEGDEVKVAQLMSFYRTIYRIVAVAVLLLGCALIPFLPYIVENSVGITDAELRLYFAIFLANTVIGYFVSYKFGYLNALQRTYVTTNMETLTTVAAAVLQIIVLLITSSFVAYLLANTAVLLASRIAIAAYLNKKYPLVKPQPSLRLPPEERKVIYHEVKGVAVHQFSNVMVHGTDSIIIAAVPTLGVALVGSVSNYNMLINGVIAMAVIAFNSFIPSYGNIAATESKKVFRSVFYEVNFASFWVYGLCAICFFVLIPPFIQLWIGDEYLIDTPSFILILVNCFLQGMCAAFNNARIAKGNFNKDKWWSLLQALTNLVVSVVGAIFLGLVGVFIGTVASRLVFVVFRPISMYEYCFGTPVREYFLGLMKYSLATALVGAVTYALTIPVLADVSWGTLCGAGAICIIVPNVLFYLVFRHNDAFRGLRERVCSIVRSRAKRS